MSIIKNRLLIGVLSFLLLVQIGSFGIYQVANAQSEIGIPGWVKNNAGWWANGDIDDGSFVQGIQFLIKEGIMEIPPTTQGEGSGSEIPGWVKNNAGWWANGDIDDGSFVQGIQFLIKEGIMEIPPTTQGSDSDDDGILDDVDVCPNDKETVNGFEDSDGCPDVVPIGDSDDDGILDDVDVCPNDKETVNGFEDSDGCPDVVPFPDNPLTIINPPNFEVKRTGGWSSTIITLEWTYFVEHENNSGEGFPKLGHFVVDITGFASGVGNAEYIEGNEFSGSTTFVDNACSEGEFVIEIQSFIGDDRGTYQGDGDIIEKNIPPCRDPDE